MCGGLKSFIQYLQEVSATKDGLIRVIVLLFYLFKKNFLAMPRSSRDLSSPTRD